MRLEDEIKQESFSSEYQKAVLNIAVTSSWLESIFSSHLKPHGLSSQQYNVLRILRGQGDDAISVNDIMSRMIDKMSNASRLVEKLKQKELIERIICEEDRRQVDVKITKKGLILLEKMDKTMDGENVIKNSISQKEATQLSEILEKIRK